MPDPARLLSAWLVDTRDGRHCFAVSPYYHALVSGVRSAEAASADPMPIIREALIGMASEITRLIEEATRRAAFEIRPVTLPARFMGPE